MTQREQVWTFEDSPDSLWVNEVDDTGEPMFVSPASDTTSR